MYYAYYASISAWFDTGPVMSVHLKLLKVHLQQHVRKFTVPSSKSKNSSTPICVSNFLILEKNSLVSFQIKKVLQSNNSVFSLCLLFMRLSFRRWSGK